MATLHNDPETILNPQPPTSERTYHRDDRYEDDLYQDDTCRYEQDRDSAITGGSPSTTWEL